MLLYFICFAGILDFHNLSRFAGPFDSIRLVLFGELSQHDTDCRLEVLSKSLSVLVLDSRAAQDFVPGDGHGLESCRWFP